MQRRTPSRADRDRVREVLEQKGGGEGYHLLIFNVLSASETPLCCYEIANRIPSHIRSATNIASRLREMILAEIVVKTSKGESPVSGKIVQFYDLNPTPPQVIEFKKPPAFWYIQYHHKTRYDAPVAILPAAKYTKEQVESIYKTNTYFVDRLSFSSVTN